jgi:hypothetical protein
MLLASLCVLGLAVALGLWLGGQSIHLPGTKPGLRAAGCLHGACGAAGIALLGLALRGGPSAHAVRLGAGGFGHAALWALAAALGIGAVFLGLRVARRKLPLLLVAAHGILAIAGAVLLMAYAGLQN